MVILNHSVDMQFLMGFVLIPVLGLFALLNFVSARKQSRIMARMDLGLKNIEQMNQHLNAMLNEQRRTNRILAELAGEEMSSGSGYGASGNGSSSGSSGSYSHSQMGHSQTVMNANNSNSNNNNYKGNYNSSPYDSSDIQSQAKLYVGNIDYSATEAELEAHFAPYGQVEFVNIPINRYNGRARGFGFVTFVAKQDAERAMILNGSEFKGRQIQVNFAKEREAAQ